MSTCRPNRSAALDTEAAPIFTECATAAAAGNSLSPPRLVAAAVGWRVAVIALRVLRGRAAARISTSQPVLG